MTPVSPPVSCFVYTLNEEVNLPHCLQSLHWCDDVVVVDSHSADGTESLAREANARFVRHPFTGFGDQRNWSLDHVPVKHPWVLILDADERVPDVLAEELALRLPAVPSEVGAFRVRRRFHLWGRWLRHSSLYPTWVVRLVRVGRVRYVNRGHAETQIVDGRIESLHHDLIDENHKGIEDWFQRQVRYASQEARRELEEAKASAWGLLSPDPLVRRQALKGIAKDLPLRPLWYWAYSYLIRGGFLDGLDGFRFCCMKAMFEGMVVLKKRELRLLPHRGNPLSTIPSPHKNGNSAPLPSGGRLLPREPPSP